MSGIWLWFLSRGAGVATLVLFTSVVVLGAATASPRRTQASSALVITALHRTLALGAVVFLGLHVVTAIVDTYVDIGWIAAIVPFTSGYQPVGVAFGTLALDVVAAIVITSLLRHRVPEHRWRTIHWAGYAFAALAVIHGFLMATDDQPVLLGITLACGVTMLAALAWRLVHASPDRRRRRVALSQEWM
ncbi:ferric reductase-like transmembrane domain-containing protein [Gordonia sp. NPDC003424]